MKKILAGFIFALILCSLAGCNTTPAGSASKVEGDSLSSQPTVDNNYDNASQVDNEDTYIDFEQVCEKIKIGDKQVDYPFSLNDLGGGFAYDFEQISFTEKAEDSFIATCNILRNGTVCMDAAIDNVKADEKENQDAVKDMKIGYLHQGLMDQQKSNVSLEVDGIKIGDDIKKVTQVLGKPSSAKFLGDRPINYTYYGDEACTQSISFLSLTEDGTVSVIKISG
ncbi:MAG TPA: hypothetical protein GX401_01050 [Clostridiales bacterium]|nr:hypothetical protein [Clostridiales bacterium]